MMVTKEKDTQRRFFYHWVKQKDWWSVHFKNKCIHRPNLVCNVPAETHNQKSQPVRVMRGWANEIEVTNTNIIIK